MFMKRLRHGWPDRRTSFSKSGSYRPNEEPLGVGWGQARGAADVREKKNLVNITRSRDSASQGAGLSLLTNANESRDERICRLSGGAPEAKPGEPFRSNWRQQFAKTRSQVEERKMIRHAGEGEDGGGSRSQAFSRGNRRKGKRRGAMWPNRIAESAGDCCHRKTIRYGADLKPGKGERAWRLYAHKESKRVHGKRETL